MINVVAVSHAAIIAEVTSPAAAFVAIFHLILFIFELEGGANIDTCARSVGAAITVNEQVQFRYKDMHRVVSPFERFWFRDRDVFHQFGAWW